MEAHTGRPHLWVVILAGGEGRRMAPLIRRWLGRDVPKQYCAFVGQRSLLQHTIDRAERLRPGTRWVLVVAKAHAAEVERQLVGRRRGLVLFQPASRDTTAGLFLALTHIRARDPLATVVVYPSDHFVYPEERFLDEVRKLIDGCEALEERVALLAVRPECAETDYGWIELGHASGAAQARGLREVRSFVEKPAAAKAAALLASGGVWNTLILASRLGTLWSLGKNLCPEVTERFESVARHVGTAAEHDALESIYRTMPRRGLSEAILQRVPGRLVAAVATDVIWSDWGRPERIDASLRRIRKRPAFPVDWLAEPVAEEVVHSLVPPLSRSGRA